MRAHGIADFPDPNSQGGLSLNAGPGSDLSQSNPQFQAAHNACKSLLPAAPPSGQPGKAKATALKYSQCMRAHGIADFPDPSSDGALQLRLGGDLSPSNPHFQAAQAACRSLQPGGAGGGAQVNGSAGGGS
jgi:hypothetical protein